MSLDTTVGGASANSYADVDYAQAYFNKRLYSDLWDQTSDDDIERAMLTAMAELEQKDDYGERASTTQALNWPRIYVQKRDAYWSWSYYLPTEIPTGIKDAQCELALMMLNSEWIVQNPGGGMLESLQIGPVNMKVTQGGSSASGFPAQVSRLLRGLKYNLSGVPMVRA